jgi:hypothetical protein
MLQLKKVHDQVVILEMLQTCKDKNLDILFWRLTHNSKLIVEAKIEFLRKSRHEIVLVTSNEGATEIKELIGSRDFADIYIPDSGLLLRCPVKSSNENKKIVLQVPPTAAMLERRERQRINVFETNEVSLNFSKVSDGLRPISQGFNKYCFDISSGGFSFFISRLESRFFKIHDPIRNIQISLPGHTFKASAEITIIKEAGLESISGLAYKSWRVCCKFNQIDDISRKYIERYIFERLEEDLHAINS